jgi:hypothetical protein
MNPDRLSEARSLAAKSAEPFVAWMDLKCWSLGKGPAATRAAIVSFMETHGSRPEAAAILPEISRLALQLPEPERKELLQLTNRTFSAAGGFSSRFAPVPRSIGAPLPNKAAKAVSAPPDIVRMIEQRDAIFTVSRSLGLPKPPRDVKRAEKPQLTRGSFERVLASGGHGHAIVHSLAEMLSAHGHDACDFRGVSGPAPEAAPVRAVKAPPARGAHKASRKCKARKSKAAKRKTIKSKTSGRKAARGMKSRRK